MKGKLQTIAGERSEVLRSLSTASLLAFGIACSGAESVETNQSAATNRNAEVTHSSPQQRTAIESLDGGGGGGVPQPSGSVQTPAARAPGGTPIDTSRYDADITRLEGVLRKRGGDRQAQQELADAYATRAARLTEAQQYRSALGDWRRTAKLDPANESAQNMIATITSIMQSMNRPLPAPGEEPTPLPFVK